MSSLAGVNFSDHAPCTTCGEPAHWGACPGERSAYRAKMIADEDRRHEREIAAGIRAPIYRRYQIYFDPPPIPYRGADWHFVHDDYDGAEDSNDPRGGSAASPEDCREEIDWIEDEICTERNVARETLRAQLRACPEVQAAIKTSGGAS